MRKTIIFTDHAVERMKERGISEAQVRSAIMEPSCTMPGSNPSTTRIHEVLRKGQEIQVTYRETNKTILVITACWR